MIFLDTHVIVWLYGKQFEFIPESVQEKLDAEELLVSPMVVLELEYLFECKKIKVRGKKIIDYLIRNLGLIVSNESFTDIVQHAINEKWTRDPFDRIITAHAKMQDATLLTRDKIIRKNYVKAIWE